MAKPGPARREGELGMDPGANDPRRLGERVMQTFRMPRSLVAFLKAESARGGRDLTAHVVRWLEGMRSYFGLPEAARALLEADRQAMGMERFEYVLHALYARSLELREKGPGFDAPGRDGDDPDR
jgi:hypothetical protein